MGTSSRGGSSATGLALTGAPSWQCAGPSPARALAAWRTEQEVQHAAAAAATGGSVVAPHSSHSHHHPYVPHALAHRVLPAATLPALESHLRRLGATPDGGDPMTVAAPATKGAAGADAHALGDVAAPGTVVLLPLLPPPPVLGGGAPPVQPPARRTNARGARDVYQLPVPLADGRALLAAASFAPGAGGGAAGGAGRGWCPHWAGYESTPPT
jgi:hypothetical protein